MLPTRADRPVALPAGFVEALQMREPSAPVVAEVIATFAANAIVRILAGAFRGTLGRVVSSGGKATRLKIEAFGGRATTVTLPTVDLVEVTS